MWVQSSVVVKTLVLIEAIAQHISKTRDPLQHYAALERAIG
ncbi:hypothetical protein [Microcoleus sp.]